jgi:hypothetical protein
MTKSRSSLRTSPRRRAKVSGTLGAVLGALGLVVLLLVAGPVVAKAQTTYSETTGSVANTWTNYTNAGGTQGPSISAYETVQVACVVQGFQVADGNANWYQVASSPWNDAYYVSADAFYNDGATSGSLHGTPFVDPDVPSCGSSPAGYDETVGSTANTWTNYTNAGGTEGPSIAAYQTVVISCRLTGFKVADGNTWWYQVASSPWNDAYYVSADAFYNDGATSGSLRGTPFVDQAVPVCAGTTGGSAPPAPNPNPEYNRTAAINWALANAKDPQHYTAMCTWFVSNVLWAGGLPQTSLWNNYAKYGSTVGTADAWLVQDFVSYLRAHFSTTLTNITADFKTNAVPQAEPGDIILYDWGQGEGISHATFIVDLASGDYPEVAEWGQFNTSELITRIFPNKSSYVKRGWTWSAVHNEWLQKEYPHVKAYLLHINGGFFAKSLLAWVLRLTMPRPCPEISPYDRRLSASRRPCHSLDVFGRAGAGANQTL